MRFETAEQVYVEQVDVPASATVAGLIDGVRSQYPAVDRYVAELTDLQDRWVTPSALEPDGWDEARTGYTVPTRTDDELVLEARETETYRPSAPRTEYDIVIRWEDAPAGTYLDAFTAGSLTVRDADAPRILA